MDLVLLAKLAWRQFGWFLLGTAELIIWAFIIVISVVTAPLHHLGMLAVGDDGKRTYSALMEAGIRLPAVTSFLSRFRKAN